jgi:hypothetical protein
MTDTILLFIAIAVFIMMIIGLFFSVTEMTGDPSRRKGLDDE